MVRSIVKGLNNDRNDEIVWILWIGFRTRTKS
jgi:hypothetical protein